MYTFLLVHIKYNNIQYVYVEAEVSSLCTMPPVPPPQSGQRCFFQVDLRAPSAPLSSHKSHTLLGNDFSARQIILMFPRFFQSTL